MGPVHQNIHVWCMYGVSKIHFKHSKDFCLNNILEMEQLRPGLISIKGGSCFLNAVVQCICTVFMLADSVPSIEPNSNVKVEELYRLCSQMQVAPLRTRRITPSALFKSLPVKIQNGQQDVSELLDCLCEEGFLDAIFLGVMQRYRNNQSCLGSSTYALQFITWHLAAFNRDLGTIDVANLIPQGMPTQVLVNVHSGCEKQPVPTCATVNEISRVFKFTHDQHRVFTMIARAFLALIAEEANYHTTEDSTLTTIQRLALIYGMHLIRGLVAFATSCLVHTPLALSPLLGWLR